MGSYTALFTVLHLKEKYNPEPVHLFVSSISPPHVSNFIFLREGGGKEGSAVGKSTHLMSFDQQ